MWQFERVENIDSNWGTWYAVIVLSKDGQERPFMLRFAQQPTNIQAIQAGLTFCLQKNLNESPTLDLDRMTREEFFGRFTPTEIATIYQLAAVNHDVFAYVKLAEINPTVHRRYPPVEDGLRMLEAAGVLAAGRTNEILGYA